MDKRDLCPSWTHGLSFNGWLWQQRLGVAVFVDSLRCTILREWGT